MTKVFAHRGASAVEPENTIAAFLRAAAMGADGVELDVRRGLLVHHDPVPVDHPPSLAAALDACAGMTVNIEIKNLPGDDDFDPEELLAAQVVELLHQREGRDDVIVSSFNLSAINRVRQLDAAIPTAFLVVVAPDAVGEAGGINSDVVGRVIDRCRRHGHGGLNPHHLGVTPRFVGLARAAGLAISTWTVDDPARMRELAALGVDSIITNVPDLAIATLRA